eukprot:616785-Rhodomonas_salina.6
MHHHHAPLWPPLHPLLDLGPKLFVPLHGASPHVGNRPLVHNAPHARSDPWTSHATWRTSPTLATKMPFPLLLITFAPPTTSAKPPLATVIPLLPSLPPPLPLSNRHRQSVRGRQERGPASGGGGTGEPLQERVGKREEKKKKRGRAQRGAGGKCDLHTPPCMLS